MPTDQLSDAKVRNAKPKDRPYKLADGLGLYLLVHSNGSRYWRFKYRFAERERTYAIGVYPDVTLAEARAARDEARGWLRAGRDPVEERRAREEAATAPKPQTFRELFLEWHERPTATQTERHRKQILRTIELHLFPRLGAAPAAAVTPAQVLAVLHAVENAGAHETAHRLRMWASMAYRYAIAADRLQADPFGRVQGALKPRERRNFAALAPADVPAFLAKLDAYDGHPLTRLALLFTLHTFGRTTEVRFATWDEFDLGGRLWLIPEDRMKKRRDHAVPLTDETLALLESIRPYSGRGRWLFPQATRDATRPMSENTMLYAVYRMGYHNRTTVHGFRATASTVLNGSRLFREDAIERQLSHVEQDKTRAAYNRFEYLEERREIMGWWSRWLVAQAGGGAADERRAA